MVNFEQKRNKKIQEIILILKITYIALSIIAVLENYTVGEEVKSIIILPIFLVVISTITMIYFLWVVYNTKNRADRLPTTADVIETIIMLSTLAVVICITNFGESKYKLLSIFIVLISVIQFGSKYSLCTAVVCTTIILFVDLVLSRQSIASTYFESDIILISALFIVSVVMGLYVDTEKQHSKELQELVNIDELTGLYNHRYFQEFIQKAMIDANTNKSTVSLLFMDIDYFKNFNDINGHQAGDFLLKQLGKILKESIRENDVVARYGGEEFAVILPNTPEEKAIKIGERIRQVVQNTYFEGQENQPNKNVTISIGVSSYPNRASNKHQFINTADDALYRAKSFNKNRVESYHSVLDGVCRQLEIEESTVKSLKSFINMINIKDRYTYGHTERVVIYTKWFAKYLKLDDEQKIQLQLSAYLHDIGKLEIPENVLNKRGKLTDEEYQMFRKHPKAGIDLIQHIEPFDVLIPIIKHHHERYDGKGYPDGLKGEEIPFLARIVTIADSFDAMTSNRQYNVRKTHEKAIQELKNHAGTQFDPILVDKFIDMLDKYKEHF